ncbi:MAG: hypothetical protein ACK5YR_20730 [Pirellula sp.]
MPIVNLATWTIQPILPMGAWWLLVMVSIVVVVGYLWRSRWDVLPRERFGIVLLLTLSLACPLIVLLNPISVETIARPDGKPQVHVLLDASASMRTDDIKGTSQATRWASALDVAKTLARQHPSLDVQVHAFADSGNSDGITVISPLDEKHPGPVGRKSDLRNALNSILKQTNSGGQAVFLLSDGAHNAGAERLLLESADVASSLNVPIYTTTFGTESGVKNVVLTARSPRLVMFPGRNVVVRLSIDQRGFKQEKVEVIAKEGDTILASQTLRLPTSGPEEIRFDIAPMEKDPSQTAPEFRQRAIRFEVATLPDEATDADNHVTVLMQPLEKPIETLVLEGKPYWDNKFLVRNFSSDPVLKVTAINRVNDDRFVEQKYEAKEGGVDSLSGTWRTIESKELPLDDLEKLKQYRVIVLGRESGVFLSPEAIENVRQWLSQEGGCLVCSRGAPSSTMAQRLADIMPVRWTKGSESRFRGKLSDYGSDQIVLDSANLESDPLEGMPSLETNTVSTVRPGLPQILMESRDSEGDSAGVVPVITYQPYGMGQTIVVEGSGMWRWAFLPPQNADRDTVYPSLWQGLIQWIVARQDLLPGQQVALRPDRSMFLGGEEITGTMIVREASITPPSLELYREGEKVKQVQPVASGTDPGVYRFDFGVQESGFFEVRTMTLKSEAGKLPTDGEQQLSSNGSDMFASTICEVRDFWLETLDVDARPDLMYQLAVKSGGRVVEPSDARGVLDEYHAKLQAARPEQFKRTPLWDRPWVLLTILGIWLCSWWIRRTCGLI